MASVLRPGGLLILQNLNYDLRWQKQPRWFAAQGGELDGQQVLVWRFADYDVPAGRIAFTSRCSARANATGKSMFTQRPSGRFSGLICWLRWPKRGLERHELTLG